MEKEKKPIIKNTIKRVANVVKDKSVLKKLKRWVAIGKAIIKNTIKNLKRWVAIGSVAIALAGSLASCSAEVNIPEQHITPPTQEQQIELIDGEHILKVGNLQEIDKSDLIASLPEKYKNNYTTFGNQVSIFGIEDNDFAYMLSSIDYDGATYYIQSKNFTIRAIGITLDDVNNYIQNADIRYGKAILTRFGDNNFSLTIEGISNYKDRDTVMSILKDATCIQRTYDSSTKGYTKEHVYDYINKESNTLEVCDRSNCAVYAGDYLDLQNVSLDRIELESGYVLYDASNELGI